MTFIANTSIRDQILFIIKDNPGILRTEVPVKVGKAINVVTPAIKELIDNGLVSEGMVRVSKTTGKNGKTLWISADWEAELNAQNKLWEE